MDLEAEAVPEAVGELLPPPSVGYDFPGHGIGLHARRPRAKSPGCLEVLKASFDQEMDGYRESCVTSAAMYPDWFDMPEGKEGGAAFLAKRKPEFWRLREREADARQALIDAYQAESKPQDKES